MKNFYFCSWNNSNIPKVPSSGHSFAFRAWRWQTRIFEMCRQLRNRTVLLPSFCPTGRYARKKLYTFFSDGDWPDVANRLPIANLANSNTLFLSWKTSTCGEKRISPKPWKPCLRDLYRQLHLMILICVAHWRVESALPGHVSVLPPTPPGAVNKIKMKPLSLSFDT